MNPNEIISICVSVITAFITLAYLWKTRVVGADRELIRKYKDDYEEIKSKYETLKKDYKQKDIQLDMCRDRIAELRGRMKQLTGQEYWPDNHSLEVEYDPNQAVSKQY